MTPKFALSCSSTKICGSEMAAILVSALPVMRKRASDLPGPFLFSISKAGKLTRLE